MPTSVALGSYFEGFVKDQVASGRYNNASEVIREGLRILEQQQEDRRLKIGALRAEIDKGLEGPFYPAGQVFSELEQKLEVRNKRKASDT